MRVVRRRIRYGSRTDCFSLWFAGDLHVGSASCDEAAIGRWVRTVAAEDNALVFLLGDLAEFIPRNDWRFRQSRLAGWLRGLDADYCDDIVDQQIRRVVSILSPIAPKIVGALSGNHESRQLARWERDVHAAICRELKIENLGMEAMIRLTFTRGSRSNARNLDLYLHHGWFAGRKPGAKVNNLVDLFAHWDVDIIAVGHGHERLVAPAILTQYLNQADEVVVKRRIALMAGAFMSVHEENIENYADERGYRKTDRGPIRILYKPSVNDIVAEL